MKILAVLIFLIPQLSIAQFGTVGFSFVSGAQLDTTSLSSRINTVSASVHIDSNAYRLHYFIGSATGAEGPTGKMADSLYIPANTLTVNGQMIHCWFRGSGYDSVFLLVNGALITAGTLRGGANSTWECHWYFIRTTLTTYACDYSFIPAFEPSIYPSGNNSNINGSYTFANAGDIKVATSNSTTLQRAFWWKQ